MGSSEDPTFYIMETHYDNPTLESGNPSKIKKKKKKKKKKTLLVSSHFEPMLFRTKVIPYPVWLFRTHSLVTLYPLTTIS